MKKLGYLLAICAGVFLLSCTGQNDEQGEKKHSDNGAEYLQEGEIAKSDTQKSDVQKRVEEAGLAEVEWESVPCIVVDPGHGGFDPGKVGINDVKEKDINLRIADRLREYLEASGVKVVMTRNEDRDLCGQERENMKVRDLKQRIQIIEDASPTAAVSIHQNSYPEEYVKGAQVFYYENSIEGQKLAGMVQDSLIREADSENKRQIKGNTSYYLLKKTKAALIIVECGFLSNRSEAEKLCTEEYQDAVARAVYLGVMEYLMQKK